jgi:hypothetical protein
MNIVSGFISNVNRRSDRDITKYIKYGLELMAVEISMTVFIEREVFETHILPVLVSRGLSYGREDQFAYRVDGGVMDGTQQIFTYMRIGHITFVFFRVCDLFLWLHRKMAHRFALNTGNPGKDTLEYMMVQCQKSEWMVIASQLLQRNLFSLRRPDGSSPENLLTPPASRPELFADSSVQDRSEYVWIDFGAFHMFQGKIDVFQLELYKMRARVNRRILQSGLIVNRLMFARCWDPNHAYYGDIYKDVNWLFAGSVFGGGALVINKFALRVREKCFQVLRERNTLMWEINIWVLIYRECPELFSLYPSDHSEILFHGYN